MKLHRHPKVAPYLWINCSRSNTMIGNSCVVSIFCQLFAKPSTLSRCATRTKTLCVALIRCPPTFILLFSISFLRFSAFLCTSVTLNMVLVFLPTGVMCSCVFICVYFSYIYLYIRSSYIYIYLLCNTDTYNSYFEICV